LLDIVNLVSNTLKEYVNGFDAMISTFKYNSNYPFFTKIECLLESNNERKMGFEEHKYDNIPFTKKFYTNSELFDYLNHINKDKGPTINSENFKEKLDIEPSHYTDSSIEIIYNELFYGQINPYSNIPMEKPLRSIFYKLFPNYRFFENGDDEKILLKKGEPFFPNSLIAYNLMRLNMDTIYNGILFLIPLHKKNFKSIVLTEKLINFELNEKHEGEQLCIYYAKDSKYKNEIIPYTEKLDLEFFPDYIEILLINENYQILDRRKWSKEFQNNQHGILHQHSENEIEAFLVSKESSSLKRKNFSNYDILKKKEEDLIESIVAFSNYKGGKIIIGVEDKNFDIDDIKGFEDVMSLKELRRRIGQIIRRHCIPSIEFNLSIDHLKNGKKILIMDIPEGKKKPYVWDFGNIQKVFVRYGEEDMPATRNDLIDLCSNNNNNKNHPYDSIVNMDSMY
jgi:hypothetical protein